MSSFGSGSGKPSPPSAGGLDADRAGGPSSLDPHDIPYPEKPIMRRASLLVLLLALHACTPAAVSKSSAGETFDILITDGRILDGTGADWYEADIGIRGDRIAAIGDLDDARAARTIDARGIAVLPGFIDIHSHADDGARARGGFRDEDPRRRAAPNLVMQGVTTVVVNHDGRSPWPIAEQRALIETHGIGPNAILLAGHGTIRGRVMGDDVERPATPEEVLRMREMVRQAMEEGAFGLSAGLEYVPGRWSETDEVVAMTEEIVPYGGIYISHQRSEGADPMWYWPSRDGAGAPDLLHSVAETIEIGERTGATVIASHIKSKGTEYRGSSAAVIEMIEAARARGVSVYADQYPYGTSGTDGNTVLIPRWALDTRELPEGTDADHAAALRQTLEGEDADALRLDIAHEIARRGGADRVVVFEYPDTALIGKSVGELAEARGISAVETAITLQLEGDPARRGGGRLRGFSMYEPDIEAFAAEPWVATASDAGIALLDDDRSVHARFYGTFPRKIAHYSRARGVLSLEQAIRSATTLPAEILGLADRGALRVGGPADIAVIDLENVQDNATFFEPHQHPTGVEYVLVNGELVVDGGEPTWALPGRVITR
jgi:N-acyl-D-amino-acid deacylase